MKIEARIGAMSQAIREENKFENHYIVQRRLKRSLLGVLKLALLTLVLQFLLKSNTTYFSVAYANFSNQYAKMLESLSV